MATVEELRDKQIESLDRRVSESHQDLKDDIRESHQDLKGDIRELRQDIRELRQVLFVVVAAALVSVVGILFQIFSK